MVALVSERGIRKGQVQQSRPVARESQLVNQGTVLRATTAPWRASAARTPEVRGVAASAIAVRIKVNAARTPLGILWPPHLPRVLHPIEVDDIRPKLRITLVDLDVAVDPRHILIEADAAARPPRVGPQLDSHAMNDV
eukprot:scaffold257443_cov27-Tisochrysis_lutea.AAC.1